MDKTSLGDRMKGYEQVSASKLMRRTPVVIRVDGKAFHTLTKVITNQVDPSVNVGFSDMFHEVMLRTAMSLANNIQNVAVVYTQSDEISIVLRDWTTHETQQWFGSKLQKIVSISAAMASVYFNQHWVDVFKSQSSAMFDARAFNIPFEEVNNYMIWRQKDAERNSVQFIARKFFSHKELHKKNNSQILDMLLEQHQILWQRYPTWQKRGSCICPCTDSGYYMDECIPQFVKEPRFIEEKLSE